MDLRSGSALVFAAALLALPLGCAQSARPLTADLFAPPPVELPRLNDGSMDAPPTSAEMASPTKASIMAPLQPRSLGSIQPLEALDMAVKTDTSAPDSADSVAQTAAALDAAQTPTASSEQSSPAPVPGTSTGVYMTLGAVLARVNGTPIYSGQVLHRLEKEFAAKSRDMNEQEFREFARAEIIRQRDELIQDEMIFDLALNQLDEKDREMAEMITINIKQEKITAAGGSVEAAKRRSAADGEDFDDAMTRTYREIVHELVQRKVIEPMVQIGRDDLFKFYQQNVGKLYSEKSRAQFRVIQIDPALLAGAGAGDDLAKLADDKIKGIHQKAVAGAEFVALASAENTDSYLRAHGGDPGGWMEPNTYRVEEVEKAVWQLQPGDVTPVINCNGVYYIAKLFDKKIGLTRQFGDPEVQTDIYNRLRQQQISDRWQMTREQLQGDADIVATDDRVDIAVDLAMQKYHP